MKNVIRCNNNSGKAVRFIPNGGNLQDILVFALQDGEYWFSIGKGYKTPVNAKRAAIKAFSRLGYTFCPVEMSELEIVA